MFPGNWVFYRFYGLIPALKINPVRKVGSTWVSKGQCFETPAFGAIKAPKIARNCFRFSMSRGCSHWILKFQNQVTEFQNQVTEYWSFKSDYWMFQIRAGCLDLGLPGSWTRSLSVCPARQRARGSDIYRCLKELGYREHKAPVCSRLICQAGLKDVPPQPGSVREIQCIFLLPLELCRPEGLVFQLKFTE